MTVHPNNPDYAEDVADYIDIIRRKGGSTKALHVSNYTYVIDTSESHIVMYHSPHEPLQVHEVEVIKCRTPIDDNDYKFYVSEATTRMLRIPDVLPYWGYMGIPWVDPDFAKYIKVVPSMGKLIVCLSHIDYDTL